MYSPFLQRYRYSLILLRELVITEFKLRYQGSILGYLWSLLRPIFLFVILYFVFTYFLGIGRDMQHWPVSMLLGIVLWNFFSEVTNNGVTSIVNRGDVIRKINFPKYVIVISGTISAFINLLLNLAVLLIFMVINDVHFTWSSLLAPVFMGELFIFALGIAFFLSAVFVKLRDINYIWEIIMQGLFYASAVIYPVSMVVAMNETVATILLLNPVAQAIQDTRHTLVDPQNLTLWQLSGNRVWVAAIPVVIVILTFLFGSLYFKKKSPYFAENV